MAPRAGDAQGPRAKGATINFAKDSNKSRFELPKASIACSKSGRPVYGLPERPVVHALGPDFEQAKARQQAARQQRAAAPPAGRRHDPFWAYIAAAAERERRQAQQAESGAQRCRHTVFERIKTGPTQVAGALTWQPVQPPPRARRGSQGAAARAATAPAAGQPHSWDLSRQALCTAASPRFQARSQADTQRVATAAAHTAAERGQAQQRQQWHAQRRASRAARTSAAQRIEERWPHGAPNAQVRGAKQQGLVVGGLGYGELQSMKTCQFEALRSTIKMP